MQKQDCTLFTFFTQFENLKAIAFHLEKNKLSDNINDIKLIKYEIKIWYIIKIILIFSKTKHFAGAETETETDYWWHPIINSFISSHTIPASKELFKTVSKDTKCLYYRFWRNIYSPG